MAEETTQQKEFTADDETVHVHIDSGEEYHYSGTRARVDYVAEQMRSMAREVVDGMLRRVPPDVVEHVNNSRKELLMAFRGLIDRELTSIDKGTRHVYDLHKAKDDAKAAQTKPGEESQ